MLTKKLFHLLKKTTCKICDKRFTSIKAETKNENPFSKMNIYFIWQIYTQVYFFYSVKPYSESPKDQPRLYVWGMAEHGALGDLKIRSREHKITFIYRPVRLRFSYSHKVPTENNILIISRLI